MQISAKTECAAIGPTQKSSSDLLKRSLIAIPALLLLASVIYIHGLYAKIVVLVLFNSEAQHADHADAFVRMVYILWRSLGNQPNRSRNELFLRAVVLRAIQAAFGRNSKP